MSPVSKSSLKITSTRKSSFTRRKSLQFRVSNNASRAKWTKLEKEILIESLSLYGPTRISRLCEAVPSKTKSQIKNFLFGRARAAYLLTKEHRLKNLKKTRKSNGQPCLTIQILEDQKNVRGPKTAISHALLLLSELEAHPPPTDSTSIDFKCLYTALYMASRGYPLPDMNAATHKFLLDSMENVLFTAAGNVFSHSAITNESTDALDLLLDNNATNPLGFSNLEMRARVCLNNEPPAVRILMSQWMDPNDSVLL